LNQRQGSSDGGAVLLQAANRRYGLIESMAACLPDRRQAGKVEHRLVELLRQRIHGLACGYSDCRWYGQLSRDPAFRSDEHLRDLSQSSNRSDLQLFRH
jgi:hypothetical protein